MPTKLDLVLIALLLAVALVLLENSHRVLIAPASAEPTASSNPCAAADLRYAANRLTFLTGGYISGVRPRQLAADAACVR